MVVFLFCNFFTLCNFSFFHILEPSVPLCQMCFSERVRFEFCLSTLSEMICEFQVVSPVDMRSVACTTPENNRFYSLFCSNSFNKDNFVKIVTISDTFMNHIVSANTEWPALKTHILWRKKTKCFYLFNLKPVLFQHSKYIYSLVDDKITLLNNAVNIMNCISFLFGYYISLRPSH